MILANVWFLAKFHNLEREEKKVQKVQMEFFGKK